MKKTVLILAGKSCVFDLERVLKTRYEAVAVKDAAALAQAAKAPETSVAALVFSACVMRKQKETLMRLLEDGGLFDCAPLLLCGKRAELEPFADDARIAAFLEMPFSGTLTVKRVEAAADLFRIRVKAEKLARENEETCGETKSAFQYSVIDLIFNLVNAHSRRCGQHTRNTKLYTQIIAEDIRTHCPRYGLTEEQVRHIAAASLVHDIGKIAVPDNILFKPDRLSADEYADMRKHTTVGAQLFETTRNLWSDDFATVCRDVILYHHERYDGKGYPFGLRGDEIPISAQIVSLADVYDALSSEREYKRSLDPEKVYDMIVRGECGAFSDEMLASLARTRKQLEHALTCEER